MSTILSMLEPEKRGIYFYTVKYSLRFVMIIFQKFGDHPIGKKYSTLVDNFIFKYPKTWFLTYSRIISARRT